MKVYKYKIGIYGLGILLFLAVNHFAGNDNRNKFRKFYNTDINGKISKISPHKGAVDISVRNNTFTFIPTFVDDETVFQFFAKIGDSVFKPARADTFILIHNGKNYQYRFTKL